MYTKQGLCSNCSTTVTPLWRRGVDGSYLCNACGLYYKIHKKHRPTELKTDTFRQRNRFRRDYIPDTQSLKHYYEDKGSYDHRMSNINFYDTFYDMNNEYQKNIQRDNPKDGHYDNSYSPKSAHSKTIFNKPIESKQSLKDNTREKHIADDEENNEAIAIKVLLSLSKIHPY